MEYVYDGASLLTFLRNCNDYYIKNLQNDVIGILDKDGNEVVSYTYDAWGKLLSVTGTMATTIGEKNPFRYRGYYYDFESGFYYLNSRYYDPAVGRFVNADTTDVLRQEQGSLIQYNLYAYCLNNPVNMDDKEGEAGVLVAGSVTYAMLKALAVTLGTVGGANFWNPVGWIALGITTVAVFTFTGISVYKYAKSKSNPDPYARPGQKKQGRENKNGNRRHKDYSPRNNKRSKKPAKPKKHTPGDDHRKYK